MTAIRNHSVLLSLATALIMGIGAPARALDILLTDGSSVPMTATQFAAAEAAAQLWENRFDDPIVVNIIISFDNLSGSRLGTTWIARTTHSYAAVRAALVTDATPGDELNAVVQLDPLSLAVVDVNGPRNATQLTLSTANAKALGLGTGLDLLYPNPPLGVDAEIVFDADRIATFDFDRSDGISSGFYDFVAIAAHEIGHALGFASQSDTQDDNPAFVLGPATLDVWRWPETGASHTLSSGYRLFNAGDAEWYDSVLNNVTLSHGSDVFDPLCPLTAGSCQASHWSADQDNVMNPALSTDIDVSPTEEDFHALDYIGYDANLVAVPFGDVNTGVGGWFPLTEFVPMYAPFPNPPWPQGPVPPQANIGWAVFMEIEELGMRSAAGFARFVPAAPVSPEIVSPSEFSADHSNLNPPGPAATMRPAALHRLTLLSEAGGGVQFRFRDNCAVSGCAYDASLGEFGGYRVPGQLDATGDGVQDVDGRVVWIVLVDEGVTPDPQSASLFSIDTSSAETFVQLIDREAFGLAPLSDSDGDDVADTIDNCVNVANSDQRDTDADGFGNVCDADQNNDCIVNVLDLAIFRTVFFSDDEHADLNGDGVVNVFDIALMRPQAFGPPGPSAVANICE